jgi:hypothetical protein
VTVTSSALAIALLLTSTEHAPPVPDQSASERIEDNSFLIEEAYNQEAGVIQHIAVFQRTFSSGQWIANYTDEWPALDEHNQVSITAQLQRVNSGGTAATGAGDLMLNYRRELLRSGDGGVVATVRLTGILPTGDAARGLGYGGLGAQINLPVSVVVAPWLVTHFNWGGTVVPSGSSGGQKASMTQYNIGQGIVWLPARSFNLMLEAVGTLTETKSGGVTERTTSVVLSPGFRHLAFSRGNFEIVWGAGVPIGLGPSAGQNGLLLYLSVEHGI